MALSNQTQIRIIGVALIALLAVCAWNLAHPLTPMSILPLGLIAYAAWRIVFELTWNRNNVPTLATGFVARRKMAEVLRKASAGKTHYEIVDLGSGRGELSRYLARSLPQTHVTGIEIARVPHAQALFLKRWLGPQNVDYLCLDFDGYDCGKVDTVVMYLSGNLTMKVGEKLQRELKPGATVITHTFPLRGTWEPTEVVHFRTPFKDKIFVYRK